MGTQGYAPSVDIKTPDEVKAVDKKFKKVTPRETPQKIKWAEIKMPVTVNLSINHTVKIIQAETIYNATDFNGNWNFLLVISLISALAEKNSEIGGFCKKSPSF